jgi:hypothetical protein
VVEVGALVGLSSVILVMVIAQPAHLHDHGPRRDCCRRCSRRSIPNTARRTSTR